MTTHDTEAIRAQMGALAGFTAGPWYTHNQPGDWGLGGAHSIHVADANPYDWGQCIAHVEYQTPYCLGERRSVIEATQPCPQPAPDAVARLVNALESGKSFAESWIEENGGIDGCDYQDRVSYENICAVLAACKGVRDE